MSDPAHTHREGIKTFITYKIEAFSGQSRAGLPRRSEMTALKNDWLWDFMGFRGWSKAESSAIAEAYLV